MADSIFSSVFLSWAEVKSGSPSLYPMCFHSPSWQHFIRPVSPMDTLNQACSKVSAQLVLVSHPTQCMCCRSRPPSAAGKPDKGITRSKDLSRHHVRWSAEKTASWAFPWCILYPWHHSLISWLGESALLHEDHSLNKASCVLFLLPSHLSMGQKFQGIRRTPSNCNNICHISQSVMSTELTLWQHLVPALQHQPTTYKLTTPMLKLITVSVWDLATSDSSH